MSIKTAKIFQIGSKGLLQMVVSSSLSNFIQVAGNKIKTVAMEVKNIFKKSSDIFLKYLFGSKIDFEKI